jgi:integrase
MSARNVTGDGSIYKRKDGRWEAAIYLDTTGGVRKRFRFYGQTREAVRTRLAAEQHRAARGARTPDRAWKLGEYLDYWLENVVRVNRRPKTYESYEGAIRLYIRPKLGRTPLQRLTVSQVQIWLNDELSKGTSVRVVHLIKQVLGAALTRAMREELLDRNVARLVELPAWRRKDIVPWTADQLRQFLSAAEGDPLYPAFALIGLYGLRRGEVLGLRWTDIDRTAQLIHVRQQLQLLRTGLQLVPVKTQAANRDLPLLPAADRFLAAHAQLMAGQIADKRRDVGSDDLIFTTRTGHPIVPDNLLRSLKRIAKEQGLPDGTLHHLRHATVTLLKNAGVPDRDAQLIFGHAQVTTTQQLYQHADHKGQRRGLLQLEAALLPAGDGNRCRQTLPSSSSKNLNFQLFISGGPGGTRTHDILLKSSTDPSSPRRLTEVSAVLWARYRSHLLGAAAVMCSRQPSFSSVQSIGSHAIQSTFAI